MEKQTNPNNAEFNDMLLKKVLQVTGEGVVLSNMENKIIAVNPAFTEIMGFSEKEIMGQEGSVLRSGRHDDAFYAKVWDDVKNKGIWQGEMWVRRKNGSVFPEWLTFTSIKNPQGEITHFLAIFSDITERKTSAERIQFLAHYDPLTNLPNRNFLNDQLSLLFQEAQKNKHKVAILYLDIDRFDKINTSFGLVVGDQLLQAIGARLQSNSNKNKIVARLSGDKFAVVLPKIKSPEEIAHHTQIILDDLKKPFQLNGHTFNIVASVGISIYPTDGETAEILIKNAETAMYQAKENGRNGYQFFTKDMNQAAIEYLQLETRLRKAIETEGFELYYHPLITLKTGKISGAEVLIRWKKSDADPVSPAKFIPIAEDSGLIIPITNWILNKACQTYMENKKAGVPVVPLAVNISSLHFKQKDFKDQIIKVLNETKMDPHGLKLELTEGVLMSNASETIQTLLALKEKGLLFSIDDFGTGYSSLSYLKKFPIDQLKIDQSFIRDMMSNVEDQAIVRAIISLAQTLKLIVIAEGVETKEQALFLRDENCDVMQGFYFSPPIPAEKFMEMLSQGKELTL